MHCGCIGSALEVHWWCIGSGPKQADVDAADVDDVDDDVQRYLSISRRLAGLFLFPLATNSHAQSISPAFCCSKHVDDYSRFYANSASSNQ